MKTRGKYIFEILFYIVIAVLMFVLLIACHSSKSFTYKKSVEVTYNKDTVYQKHIEK